LLLTNILTGGGGWGRHLSEQHHTFTSIIVGYFVFPKSVITIGRQRQDDCLLVRGIRLLYDMQSTIRAINHHAQYY